MKKRWEDNKKLVLGITGSLGSGKTTVAKILKKWGAKIIDADKIAHLFLRPQESAYKKIVALFGKEILDSQKRINRKKLAKIVFKNKRKLLTLNRILHPLIIQEIKRRIKLVKEKIIVLDAPLLIEAGLRDYIDKLVVVKIDPRVQMKRLLKKGWTPEQIKSRIKFQIPQEEKLKYADLVIDNSGSIIETKKQLKSIRRLLWKN